MKSADWPFGLDADQDDPLTKLRIAVTGSHPGWYYLVAFHRDSEARPTGQEAAMLASYLDEYKTHWYGDNWFAQQMAERPLDVDGGANGVIFHKYAEDDWGYRRQSFTRGPLFTPQSPRLRELCPNDASLGPLSLAQLMDKIHDICPDRWAKWKAAHPEVFPT